MFLGEHQHTLDSKNRFFMPAKFREELGSQFVMAKGLDGCLFVYPLEAWQALEEKLRSLPLTKKDARAFARFFFAGASEAEMDRQGRVSIPLNLKAHAELEKDLVVIGVADRLEIWSAEKWQHFNDDADKSFEQLAELMGDFDIDL